MSVSHIIKLSLVSLKDVKAPQGDFLYVSKIQFFSTKKCCAPNQAKIFFTINVFVKSQVSSMVNNVL